MQVALVVNPRSRMNRRDPSLIDRLRAALGQAGVVHCPAPDEMPALAARLALDAPPILAVHGGDGTVHSVLTACIPAFGPRPLPPLALLAGGTMNVVLRSLALGADPVRFLAALARASAAPEELPAVERHCLRVGSRHGFVFANGGFATFLEEYYAAGSYGPMRALWLGTGLLASHAVNGAFSRRVLRSFTGRVVVDGEVLPAQKFVTVSAATVREAGLGFSWHPRADEDTTRFSVLALLGWPSLIDIVAVRRGRPMAPERAANLLAERLAIAPQGKPMPYTVDGDLYETQAGDTLEIGLGPRLRLLRPPG